MTPVDAALAARLVAAQFPQWAGLPVRAVDQDGFDHRSFRLGDHLVLRLPSDAGHSGQVAKEHAWLPRLAPHLPLPIPPAVALGAPSPDYPLPWAIRGWIEGDPLAADLDQTRLGADLAAFLRALEAVPAGGGPPPDAHGFFRGAPFELYLGEALAAIGDLGGDVPRSALERVLHRAATSRWQGAPLWVHGDVAAGNLLTAAGRLSAVIDFGGLAVGDPACDLVPAWTLLDDAGRAAFRSGLDLDDDTWARARGWCAWKALITLRDDRDAARPRRDLLRVLADAD